MIFQVRTKKVEFLHSHRLEGEGDGDRGGLNPEVGSPRPERRPGAPIRARSSMMGALLLL